MPKKDFFALNLPFNELAQGEKALTAQLAEERGKSNPDFARVILIATALEAVRVSLANALP